MDTLFFLRSYGDFVIALSACCYKQPERQVRLIASAHLKPLYLAIEAMELELRLPKIDFVDVGIQHGLLACFTNRYFFSSATIHELKKIRQFVKTIPGEEALFLEQKSRFMLMQCLTGRHFSVVHDGVKNIYAAYDLFFDVKMAARPHRNEDIPATGSVFIFPGSRKKSKCLPVEWVKQLSDQYLAKGMDVQIAGLAHEIAEYSGTRKVIADFAELCKTVVAADAVISSDSLPAHLAFLFRKPLEVHYTKAVNHSWLPPGAVAKQVNLSL